MTINGRIAILRQRLGLSQKTFGKLINRSEGYVSKVEGGKVALTKEVIDAIITVFEVPEEWLKDGKGCLDVHDVGERIKRVRAERSLTQEQLAERLGCTRNTIGLIERGQVRAGEELLHTLCSELWVNENWLLTGRGSMERAELTEIYELLKSDPAAREAVKSFIAMLENPHSLTQQTTRKEEKNGVDERNGVKMALAQVNDYEAARLFFEEYNIPYEVISRGENAGKLRVRPARMSDRMKIHEVQERLRRARHPEIIDHSNVFRDCDDNTIVTFSPYGPEESPVTWMNVSEHSIYGMWTKTFVVKC